MTQDLFRSKKIQVYDYIKRKRIFSKADIIDWGLKNYYLRADRTIRDFVQQGIVKKFSPQECIFLGLKGRMAWYEVIR